MWISVSCDVAKEDFLFTAKMLQINSYKSAPSATSGVLSSTSRAQGRAGVSDREPLTDAVSQEGHQFYDTQEDGFDT